MKLLASTTVGGTNILQEFDNLWNAINGTNGYGHTHSADDISETSTRVWVSPSEKTYWNNKLDSIPVATTSVLGGIKSGGDISIDSNGIVTVLDNSHNHEISNITGLQTALDGKVSNTGDIINGNLVVIGDLSVSNGTLTVDGGKIRLLKSQQFYVEGDANTYYPVVIETLNMSIHGITEIEIYRGYSWEAPDTWNTPTHRGSLLLSMRYALHGWGGYRYFYDTILSQQYSVMVGDIQRAGPDTDTVIVWLRGGHALYEIRYYNAYDLNYTVYYDQYVNKQGTQYETTYYPITQPTDATNFIGVRYFNSNSDIYIGTGFTSVNGGYKVWHEGNVSPIDKSGDTINGRLNIYGTGVLLAIGGNPEANNADVSILFGNNVTQTDGYGYELRYTGSESDINNSFELWATNSGNPLKVWRIDQTGIVNVVQGIKSNGTITIENNVPIIDFINTDGANNIRIHADSGFFTVRDLTASIDLIKADVNSFKYKGNSVYHEGNFNPSDYISVNEKGSANGVAPLDSSGVIPISYIPSNVKEIKVVNTIADRDALTQYEGLRVHVRDASDDPTVGSGWAEYLSDGTTWTKTAENESIDIILDWANIQNKPDFDALYVNASGDTMTGDLVISDGSNYRYIRVVRNGTIAELTNNGTGTALLYNDGTSVKAYLRLSSNNIEFSTDGNTFYPVWYGGNDGPGSGMNADKLDGYDLSANGNRWGVIPFVAADGVMEVGKYIDFHESDTDTSDYSVRLKADNGELFMNANKVWHAGNITPINKTGDSGISGHLVLDNTIGIKGKRTDGTEKFLVRVSSINNVVIGDDSNQTIIHSSQSPKFWDGTNTYTIYHEGNLDPSTISSNDFSIEYNSSTKSIDFNFFS